VGRKDPTRRRRDKTSRKENAECGAHDAADRFDVAAAHILTNQNRRRHGEARPGAAALSLEEELARVLPVVREAVKLNVPISVDTYKPGVMQAVLDAGADIINDVTGLRGDPAMLRAATECDAGLVIMHMIGTPQTMQKLPQYDDVVREVQTYFEARLHSLENAGISPERIVLDPGFGFGKTLEHNISLMRSLPELSVDERPLLVGVSRKSMIDRNDVTTGPREHMRAKFVTPPIFNPYKKPNEAMA
jgi:dihydropteroate synthase